MRPEGFFVFSFASFRVWYKGENRFRDDNLLERRLFYARGRYIDGLIILTFGVGIESNKTKLKKFDGNNSGGKTLDF